ncbi:MAG: family 20 glycosylhydrolase, partial [Spirochaetaceae bacterium]|nr:family 20 glycosylhydrolase [Spirochaetaceae bacterium]
MPDLVPLPRSTGPGRGRLDLRGGFRLAAPPGLEAEAALVGEWLSGALAPGGAGADAGAAVASGDAGVPPATVELSIEAGLGGAEEYRLETGDAGARIAAGGAAGIVRGAATLRELVLSGGSLQDGLVVTDGPRFPWRGFMLDCARNFFRVEFIERLIDLAALHKLNVFHWHLTDDQAWRLDLPSLPELARFGSRRRDQRLAWVVHKEGAYSPADARRIVAYAAARHVLVVPEIETPGHAVALLASHPELSCAGKTREGLAFEPEDRYGVFEDILCAGNEEVFGLLGKVFDDLAELFPGPYVHAGGDEAPKARWLLCPRCRAVMKAHNLRDGEGAFDPERLQAWFMGRV